LVAFGPPRLLLFVQFPTFLRDWQRLGLGDEALRALEQEVLEAPDKAPVIPHTGGLRKVRFTPPGSGRGKSGAYRVCYAYFPDYGTIALFVAFGKNEQSDLSSAQARAIGRALKAFETELHRQFAPEN
jgi:mRNA-degrading endonuclease RelE of RelBE toxin-antitoxin system